MILEVFGWLAAAWLAFLLVHLGWLAINCVRGQKLGVDHFQRKVEQRKEA